MNMISYWKKYKVFYVDDGLTLILGWYDHKNSCSGGYKALGVHWGTYPQSHGVLSPCVIPEETRKAMLAGLLLKAAQENDIEKVNSIVEAFDFFKDSSSGEMQP